MLTRPASPPTRSRAATGCAALVPTARLAHPGLVAATVALAAVPALLTLALDGDAFLLPSIVAGLAGGAALGWAVDDPAAELLATMPVGAPSRSVIRAGAAALVAGAGLGLLLLVVAVGPGLPPGVRDRGPEVVAAGALALAAGLVAARRGERAAGATAVAAGIFGTAAVAGLAFKLEELPSFTGGSHHSRWWLVALAGMVVALHAGRDPARR